MNAWEQKLLGEHVDLLTGFPFKSSLFTDDTSELRLLRGDNVVQGQFRWDGVKYWPLTKSENLTKYFLQPHDVIVAMDRPWIEAGLKFAWVTTRDIPCLLVQRVSRLRGTNGLDTDFLRYVIADQAFTDYVKRIATGATVPHISPTQIKDFRFHLPPFPIQRKIAAVLSAYDDLIENNTRRIKILEDMAQMLYREWFVHFRFPGHGQSKIVDSAMGPIPEGWQIISFSQSANFVNGYAFAPHHWSKSGLPIVKIAELKNGITEKTPRNSGVDVPSKLHVKSGDILFSWSADLDVYIWGHGEALLNQHLFKVEPLTGYEKFFLYFSLKERMGEFRNRSNGATMRHIKRSALDEVVLAVPPPELVRLFEGNVSPIVHQTLNLDKRVTCLRQTRDLLLPKLISGEVDVADLEIAGLQKE